MRPSASQAIRAQLIAAMEQRVAGVGGESRRVLEARLAVLRARQIAAPDAVESAAAPGDALTSPAVSGPAAHLGELFNRTAGNGVLDRSAYPELPALIAFRRLWSTLRADSHLQQAVAQKSPDAGPLNSAALVSRSMTLMRQFSPGYLRHFLAYVDDLAWLERLDRASDEAATKKRSRRKQK